MVSGRAATGKWIIMPRTSKVMCEITFMPISILFKLWNDLIDNFIPIKHDDAHSFAFHLLIMKYWLIYKEDMGIWNSKFAYLKIKKMGMTT